MISPLFNPFRFTFLRPQIAPWIHNQTSKITTEAPVRAPSSVPVDDAVLPFEVDSLDLRGRLTRLGPALDDILTKHDYPPLSASCSAKRSCWRRSARR